MTKILEVWRNLAKSDNFLKIISVVIAFIIWICIVNIAMPTNEKEFTKIPVAVQFEGSTPDRNGLMMLMTDTTFNINVTVSGQRANLISLSADDITASLNLNSIIAAGTYQVPISVSVSGNDILVTDISPSGFYVIQFANILTREIPIEIVRTNDYAPGYVETYASVSPSAITVTGPQDTVESIKKVCIEVDASDKTSSYSLRGNIRLLNSLNENVDRKYLTLSSTEALMNADVEYEKTVDVVCVPVNTFGGDESSYTDIILSPSKITIRGNDTDVKGISGIRIGEVKLETVDGSATYVFNLPELNGIAYTDAPADNKVTAVVKMEDTVTKTFMYSASVLDSMGLLPEGLFFNNGLTVKIRVASSDLDALSATGLSLSASNVGDGTYKITVSTNADIYYGVMGEYYVSVSQ